MTSSNNEASVAANTTLVAATPVIEAESPDTVLSPWDSDIIDLLEEVADNTDRLANDGSVQVTEPTAETSSSVALPVVEHTTAVTVVPEAAQLSTPATVTENQPQPTVVAETPAEAGQHSLARLQAVDSTSNPAQTTPLPVNSDSEESSRHTNNHRSEEPIRLANGRFASRAQLSTPFGKMLASMNGDKNDLMGYALGGALWPVAKEAMGLMHHAQGLFRRPSPSAGSNANINTNYQTTSNRNNRQSTNHTTHAANTSTSRERNTANATHTAANSGQNTTSATHTAANREQHPTNITNAGNTTPNQPSATNDQHPNQPDAVQATPETPPQAAPDQPSLGLQQQAAISDQALQTQQQQLESNQLERQTFALISEERTTQQLLKDIKNHLAQPANSCCGCANPSEIDLDGDRRNRRQSSDSRDNPRRQNKWLANAGKFAKFGGPLAGVLTAATTYQAVKDREDLTSSQKAVQVGATTAGAAGGTTAGVLAGAAIGSVVPVIGTVIGGFIGGIVGGATGGWLGNIAGETASDYLAQKPATSVVQPTEASQTEQTLEVDHSELTFKETDKLVVNNTTSQSFHHGRINNNTSTVAEPTAAAVTLPSLPAEPVPLTTDNNQPSNTEGQLPANQLTAGLTPQPVTLDEQKLGQALAKSLQQLPAERTVQQTYRSHSAPTVFSSIPTEFDDVVLTLMSHDRI